MIVRCTNCQSQFALADDQVGLDGGAVRCSVCGYVSRFKVDGPSAEIGWQVRTLENMLFTAPDLPTLQTWISEGRLHPDDEVSRTGRSWVRLGEMPEFTQEFAGFSALPRLLQATNGPAGNSGVGPPPAFAGAGKGTYAADSAPMAVPADSSPIDVVAAISSSEIHIDRTPRGIPVAVAGDCSGPQVVAELAAELAAAPALAVVPEPEPERRLAPPPPPASPASAHERPPASMLDAVSRYVRPITRPPAESKRAPVAASEGPPASPPVTAVRPPRRRIGTLVAAAGGALVLAVLAVPGIRELASWTSPAAVRLEPAALRVPQPASDDPASSELATAAQAVAHVDPAALDAADVGLTRRIGLPGLSPTRLAELRLSHTDVLVTRALVSRLLGAIDPASTERAAWIAEDRTERASAVFAGTDLTVLPTAAVERVRVRLAVAQAQDSPTATVQSPGELDASTRAFFVGAALWRESGHAPSEATLEQLHAAVDTDLAGRLVFGAALLRAARSPEAAALADRTLEELPAHPVASALRTAATASAGVTALEPARPSQPEPARASEPEPEPEPEAEPKAEAEAEAEPKAEPEAEPEESPASMSLAKLLDRGCEQVEAGRADEGVALLRKVYARKPSNLDVLICLGEGHLKLGAPTKALGFFERALAQRSGYPAALRGAARSAKQAGARDKASEYYARVLEGEPRNAEAQAFLEKARSPGETESLADPGE